MIRMCWQWQLPMLLLIFGHTVASGATSKEVNLQDSQAAQLFTQLYKRNLKLMVSLRNVSVSACENFYEHACGNFAELERADEPEDALPPYLYNKQDRMEFFDTQHAGFETLSGKLLSQLYSECKQRGVRHVLSTQPAATHWERLVQQLPFLASHKSVLSGWPFLQYQWEGEQMDKQLNWIDLAAQLASHGVATLLHVYFAKDTIYVESMPQLLCPSLAGFKDSMSEVLEGRNPQVGNIVGHEMRELCLGMLAELPQSGEQQQELDDYTLDYLRSFFQQLNFTDEQLTAARKFPLNVARINQAWQVLRQAEPRIVYNYVLWQTQQHLLYEDCFQLAKEFERLLHVEFWQWHVFVPHFTRDVALAMYQLHTTRFQKMRRRKLGRRDWFGHMLPAAVERRELQVARLLQAHAQNYLNLNELLPHYERVQFSKHCFFGNLLQLRRAQLLHSFVSPYVDEEDVRQPAYFLRHFLHFVILMLHRPIYHYYATQGLELWHSSRLLRDTDGYYTVANCLGQQSLQHDAKLEPIYRHLSSHEMTNIYRFYRSFQASLQDYYFWLQGESFVFAEQFVLDYFGLDERRVVFYAVAQQLCNRQDKFFAVQLNRGYMNLPEFQAAFQCDIDTPMNPAFKCL